MIMRNAHKGLDRKCERKRWLDRQMCRWKDWIKMDFVGIILEGLDWVCLAEDTEP
jgi:hypothetical protein